MGRIMRQSKTQVNRKGNWATSANSRSDMFRQLRQSEKPLHTVKFDGLTPYIVNEKPLSWHSIHRRENALLTAENHRAQRRMLLQVRPYIREEK